MFACVLYLVAYRADGITAENKRLREKVSALEKEIQGAFVLGWCGVHVRTCECLQFCISPHMHVVVAVVSWLRCTA